MAFFVCVFDYHTIVLVCTSDLSMSCIRFYFNFYEFLIVSYPVEKCSQSFVNRKTVLILDFFIIKNKFKTSSDNECLNLKYVHSY